MGELAGGRGELEGTLAAPGADKKVLGFLAHKKHPPVGPYSSPMPRDLW